MTSAVLQRVAATAFALCAAVGMQPSLLAAQVPSAPPAVGQAALAGVVFDSTSSRPLAGAQLDLARSEDLALLRSTQADQQGRFRFDSLAPGTYLIGAAHARLDSLGMRQLTLLVALSEGDAAAVALSVPSVPSLIVRYCGLRNFADSSGMMIGKLRQAIPDRRTVAGTVRAAWSDISFTQYGMESTTAQRVSQTDAAGQFIVCGAPARGVISVRAWSGEDSSGFVDATVPENGLLLRDLFVGPSIASAEQQTRVGIVRGSVKRPDGAPLSNVRLSVSSANTEVISADNGAFALTALPPGTHTLEARALGYSPAYVPIDIIGGEVVSVSVDMERFIALDPVMVRADRLTRMRGLEEFNERRNSGWGYFLDPAQVALRNPLRVTDLLRRMPGVMIGPAYGVAGAERIMMTGGCSPLVVIDRMAMGFEAAENIETFIFASDIRAVEVYNRFTMAPPQFAAIGSGCGTVIFWTGPRG